MNTAVMGYSTYLGMNIVSKEGCRTRGFFDISMKNQDVDS